MSKLTTCPHCAGDLTGQLDGRATWWRYRVRLYDMEVNPDEPMADSDGGLAADRPGASTVRGLWKLLGDVAGAAMAWHEETTLRGFSAEEQEKKLRGIRPTLSRNGGRACFRIGYDTAASYRDDPNRNPRYLARVDVARMEAPNE